MDCLDVEEGELNKRSLKQYGFGLKFRDEKAFWSYGTLLDLNIPDFLDTVSLTKLTGDVQCRYFYHWRNRGFTSADLTSNCEIHKFRSLCLLITGSMSSTSLSDSSNSSSALSSSQLIVFAVVLLLVTWWTWDLLYGKKVGQKILRASDEWWR